MWYKQFTLSYIYTLYTVGTQSYTKQKLSKKKLIECAHRNMTRSKVKRTDCYKFTVMAVIF
jgi:hypothetical protein